MATIYGYNEQGLKAPFVTIEGTETNVPAGSYGVNILKTQLEQYGITDLSEWTVVSLMTKGGIGGHMSAGTIRTNTNNNYPYAYFDNSGYLKIYLYNSGDSAATINYKITLMKTN